MIWNAGVMTDLDNCAVWKLCLPQVIQDRRDLVAPVNPMCALCDLAEKGISVLIDVTDRLTTNALQNGTIFDRLCFFGWTVF
jgi:hypothetical protein